MPMSSQSLLEIQNNFLSATILSSEEKIIEGKNDQKSDFCDLLEDHRSSEIAKKKMLSQKINEVWQALDVIEHPVRTLYQEKIEIH